MDGPLQGCRSAQGDASVQHRRRRAASTDSVAMAVAVGPQWPSAAANSAVAAGCGVTGRRGPVAPLAIRPVAPEADGGVGSDARLRPTAPCHRAGATGSARREAANGTPLPASTHPTPRPAQVPPPGSGVALGLDIAMSPSGSRPREWPCGVPNDVLRPNRHPANAAGLTGNDRRRVRRPGADRGDTTLPCRHATRAVA